MKSGMKKVDDTGRTGAISSRKAQTIVDEYTAKSQAAHPEDSEQQEVDGKVLYDLSDGLRHGRVPIANGAVRKADVRSAAKRKNPVSSNVASCRRMEKENRNLRHANRCLHERIDQLGELNSDLILNLYRSLGKEVPENLKSRLASLQANLPASSSHVGEDLDGENMEDEDMEDEDMEDEDMEEEDMDGENIMEDEDMDSEDMEANSDDEDDLDGDDIGNNNGERNIDDFCDLGYIW